MPVDAVAGTDISVVIPTYNRAELLRDTLESLTRQTTRVTSFEVIVVDDGSSDHTSDVVRAFESRLRIIYCYQPDLGFRVATARNAGARLARGTYLVFLDAGVLAAPGLLNAYLERHSRSRQSEVQLGYCYAYNPDHKCQALEALIGTVPPEDVVVRLEGERGFDDMRKPDFERVAYDLTRMAMPWVFFFTLNLSLPRELFWRAGGFDEDFRGWGMEDIELGYRLARRDAPMVVAPEAWAIESPHERATQENRESDQRNSLMFFNKHPSAMTELYWAVTQRGLERPLEVEWAELQSWVAVAPADVGAEVESLTSEVVHTGPSCRILVVGCGERLPSSWRSLRHEFIVCDLDETVLGRVDATAGQPSLFNVCGLRTPLADRSVDLVIITSRLAGLWTRWGDYVMAEARRVGRDVRCSPELIHGSRRQMRLSRARDAVI